MVHIRGPKKTKMLLDFARRRQTATARNTADAETASLDEATHSSGLVAQEIYERLLKRPVRLCAEIDNDASLNAVRKGYSRRLCYLRRTQRISLGCLHEVYFGGEEVEELEATDDRSINRLRHLPGEEMTADIMTKLLEAEKHWRFCDDAGLILVTPEQESART
jgi:hypothetical protein